MSNTNFLDLKQIVETVDNAFSLMGLSCNFLLLYLIITKTSAQLYDYRRVLLQNCLVDLFFNFMQFFTRAICDNKSGNFFIIITNAFGYWSPPNIVFPIYFWVLALFLALLTLPVQFVYRYFLIVRSIKLNNKQYFLLLSISFFFAISYTTYCCLHVTFPREPAYSNMKNLLMSVPYYSKEVPGFVTADIREWPLFIMFMWCYSLSGGSFIIIVWTSYKVWKHLKINEHHMTPQTKDANHQITKTLITQATVPVFVVLLPIAVIVGTVFLKIDVDGIGLIFSLFWGWIPVVNTLTTIFVVKSYRKTVLRFIRWPSNRQSHVSTIPAIAPSSGAAKELVL